MNTDLFLNDTMVKITIKDKNGQIKEFEGKRGSSLLAQAEQHGIKINAQCRRGMCGLCLCKISSGQEHVSGIRKNYSFERKVVFTCDTTVKDESVEGTIEIEV